MNIELIKLKQGNKLLLETRECVFDVELVDPSTGSILIVGGKRFLEPTQATLVGVYGKRNVDDRDTLIASLQIEKSLGIEIKYQDKDGTSSDFVTSPVVSAKVYDKDWAFEMWDTSEKDKRLKASLEEARARVRVQTQSKNDDTERELGENENPL